MKTILKMISVCLLVAVSLTLPYLTQEASAQKLKIMKKKPTYQVSPKPPYQKIQFKCASNPGLCQNRSCLTGVCGGFPRDGNGCGLKPADSQCQNSTVGALGQETVFGLCTLQGACVDHKCLTNASLCQNKPCLSGTCGGAAKNADGCAIAQAGSSCQEPLPNSPGAYQSGKCNAQGGCEVPADSLPDFAPMLGLMQFSAPGLVCHPGMTLAVPVEIFNYGAKDPGLVGKAITVELIPHLAGNGSCGISSNCQQALKETKTVVLTSQDVSSGKKVVDVPLSLSSGCLESGVLVSDTLVELKVHIKLIAGTGINESNTANNSSSSTVTWCTWQM